MSDRKTAARPFDTIHDIPRSLSLAESLLKGRNTPILRQREPTQMRLPGTDGLNLDSHLRKSYNYSRSILTVEIHVTPLIFIGFPLCTSNKIFQGTCVHQFFLIQVEQKAGIDCIRQISKIILKIKFQRYSLKTSILRPG